MMDPKDRYLEGREIVSTRLFDASRELVYQAWTEPQYLEKWWGPKGFTNTIHAYDLEPGGRWDFTMHGPDGTDYENIIIFSEIVKPERLSFEHASPPNFFMKTDFTEHLGKTRVTFRMLFFSIEDCEKVKSQVIEANEQSFDRLEEELIEMRKEPQLENLL